MPDFRLPPPAPANFPSGRCQLLVDIAPGATPTGIRPPSGDGPPARVAAVLELRVRNHPGTMSHITGLFARRGFNLEAIVCAPVDDGRASRMLLLLADEPRLDQVERQLAKLYDVLALRHRPDVPAAFFQRLFPTDDGGAAVT